MKRVISLKKGRKRAAGAIILIAMLAVICMLLVKTVFVVRSVEIRGDFAIAEADIVRASGVQFGKPLSNVDHADVEKGVNLTGKVKFESMKFRYPNTVEITVSERKPAAMLLHMGNILVLDKDGCAVEVKSQVPNEDLIYISDLGVKNYQIGNVVTGDIRKMQAYAAVMNAIDYHSAAGVVSEINFMDEVDMHIITRSGITVQLGNDANIRNKIAWMKAAVADLESRGVSGGTLDVSSGTKADYVPAG